MSKKITITIVPREVGQVIDELLDSIFKQFSTQQMTPQGNDLTKLIPHHYYPTYDLFQGECYQQYLGNTCGYHATFNTLCCLKLFNEVYSGIDYHIDSRVSFWRFKLKIQKFLIQYKTKNKLKDEWPWRMQDIINGDFERTYNQICLNKLDDFEIFRSHPDCQLMSHTWQFQYQNLLGSYDSKKQLQKKIDYYLSYKKKKPLIFSLMLAITTHWTCFLAFKIDGKSQFWFFDSFNNKILDYSYEQIVQFIDMKNQERIQFKKPQMTPFQKQNYIQCQVDIQISLKLLIALLKGQTNLRAYEYNRMFQIFADPLQSALKESQQTFFATLKDYKHNIRSFYNIPFQKNLLSTHNLRRTQQFLTASAVLSKKNSEAHLFWSYLDRCRF